MKIILTKNNIYINITNPIKLFLNKSFTLTIFTILFKIESDLQLFGSNT